MHLLIITYKLLSTYYYTYIYFTTKVDNKTKYNESGRQTGTGRRYVFVLIHNLSVEFKLENVWGAKLFVQCSVLTFTAMKFEYKARDVHTVHYEINTM